MLTGALTGIVSIPLGMAAAFLIVRPNRVRHLLPIAGALIALGSGLIGFYFFARSYKGGDVDLFETLSKRLAPMEERGMAGSNRAYVYKYIREVSIPAIGPGLGHADMTFSRTLNADVIISFINLYFYILLSGGLLLISTLDLCAYSSAMEDNSSTSAGEDSISLRPGGHLLYMARHVRHTIGRANLNVRFCVRASGLRNFAEADRVRMGSESGWRNRIEPSQAVRESGLLIVSGES